MGGSRERFVLEEEEEEMMSGAELTIELERELKSN